jgi:hypothetical protein
MLPPEGLPGMARPGGKSPLVLFVHPLRRDGFPWRGRREILRFAQDFGSGLTPAKRLNFQSRPWLLSSLPPYGGLLKKCSGMLNVLPYMVPVKS